MRSTPRRKTIEKLLDLVEKILIRARMIDNEHYFKKRACLEQGLVACHYR